jgi:hypothetical protein
MPELTNDPKVTVGCMGLDRSSIRWDGLVRQNNAWALQLVAEETKEAR